MVRRGNLLSDPKAIERIVNQNKSAAHRIVQWIKDVIAKLTKKGAKGEYYNFVRKAEKLYADAVKKSIGGISLSDVAAFEELEKLANKEELRYNQEKGGMNYGREIWQSKHSADQRYSLDNLQRQRWAGEVSSIRDFSKDSKREGLETKADRLEYLKILKDGRYTKVSVDYFGNENFISYLEIKEDALLPVLKEIRAENEKLGFKTKFVTSGFNVNGDTYNFNNVLGLYSTIYDTIYIRMHESENIILTNNHERMHNIEKKYPDIFNSYKSDVKEAFGNKYKESIEFVAKDWGS